LPPIPSSQLFLGTASKSPPEVTQQLDRWRLARGATVYTYDASSATKYPDGTPLWNKAAWVHRETG
jgi:hypothetical protein